MAITWLPGVATNITPLFTIGGASWPLTWPVDNTHTGCSRLTLSRGDLIERTVAPAVVGAADHQPVAVFGFLQAFRRHRLVILQNLRNGRGRRGGCCAGGWLLRRRAATAISRIATDTLRQRHASPPSGRLKPTRAVNGPATRSLPSIELEWQRRQRPRRFALDDLCAVRGIELRAMAGAMQDAARPRANRPPRSPYACRWRYTRPRRLPRATACRELSLSGSSRMQEHLIQTRTAAHRPVFRVHGPGHDRLTPGPNVLRTERLLGRITGLDEHIAFLWAERTRIVLACGPSWA